MRLLKYLGLAVLALVVLAGLGVGGFALATRAPEIAAVEPPAADSFPEDAVERGAGLAAIGNCIVCHTAEGGEDFAGGRALPTPFGTIHTTNITPDPETGIGRWSEEAFVRAMRRGIDREGRHLYPAFPYDYYTHTTDEDLGAIYAFLMTREPVVAEPEPNALPFPLDQRFLLAGWNMLFLDAGPYTPDPERDDEWNRGGYLVEGLAHCGACHTPRNLLGAAPKEGETAYAGAMVEGWYAPPIDEAAARRMPWTEFALVNYLIDGWDRNHGIAAGPMRDVADAFYENPEDEAFAVAAYVGTLMADDRSEAARETAVEEARAEAERLRWGAEGAPEVPAEGPLAEGAAIFEDQCADCHAVAKEPAPLALSPTVHVPTPANLIRVTLDGIKPAPLGVLDRTMPARHLQIDDAEMAVLAAFVRDRFSDAPAWEGVEELSAAIRAEVTE